MVGVLRGANIYAGWTGGAFTAAASATAAVVAVVAAVYAVVVGAAGH